MSFYSFPRVQPTATHLTPTNTTVAAAMLIAENSCSPIKLPPSFSSNPPAMGGPVRTARPYHRFSTFSRHVWN